MATREEMSRKIRQDLADRGMTPTDADYAFVLQAMEDVNAGVADLDDEIADIAARLAWLAQAPTWVNRRVPGEFDAFVDAKVAECEKTIAAVRARWATHRSEGPRTPAAAGEP